MSLFCILSLLTVFYTLLVPMLDKHVSDEQLMSIRNLKKNDSILIICVLKRTRLFKQAYAVFDQGRGLERGEGREFAISLMAVFNIHVIDIFTTY